MRLAEKQIIEEELRFIKAYIEVGKPEAAILRIEGAIERHNGWMKLSPLPKAYDTLREQCKEHSAIMQDCLKRGDINGAALQHNICSGLQYAMSLIVNSGDESKEE